MSPSAELIPRSVAPPHISKKTQMSQRQMIGSGHDGKRMILSRTTRE